MKKENQTTVIKNMAFFAMLAFVLMPEMAMAAPWDSAAEKILGIFTGGPGSYYCNYCSNRLRHCSYGGQTLLGVGNQDHHRYCAGLWRNLYC